MGAEGQVAVKQLFDRAVDRVISGSFSTLYNLS